ncbi:MAG: 4Fe-4S binding protein [Allobaculum sp.]
MNIKQIVFSPTGGTQKVLDILTGTWNMPVEKIDLSNPNTDYSQVNFCSDDLVLIGVPSYGGRVPALAGERLEQIHADHARCVLVCVYGNRAYEDTLIEMQDLAEKSGFEVVAAIAAIAEHSIMHQYGTGRPDQKDHNDLQNFAEQILEKIKGDTTPSALTIPGNRPYKKSHGGGLIPKPTEDCIDCGLCARVCPAAAISIDNVKETDTSKCISCMRCVAKCPYDARKVSEMKVSALALALKKACSSRKENELFL